MKEFFNFAHEKGESSYHSGKKIIDVDFKNKKDEKTETVRFIFQTTNYKNRESPRKYRGTAGFSHENGKWRWSYVSIQQIFVPSYQPIIYSPPPQTTSNNLSYE